MNSMLALLIVIAILFFVFRKLQYLPNGAKEQDKQLEESLKDEYLIDPQTGAKLTLEQAESGDWEVPEDRYVMPEEDIEKLSKDEDKVFRRGINYINEQPHYKRSLITYDQLDFLGETEILKKYDDWGITDFYEIEDSDGYILATHVSMNSRAYKEPLFNETQCLFWMKLKNDCGHYFIREYILKSKLTEFLYNSNELQLQNYQIIIHEEAPNLPVLQTLISMFENTKNLEIEFIHHHLLIKSMKYLNVDDIKMIEEVLFKMKKYLV